MQDQDKESPKVESEDKADAKSPTGNLKLTPGVMKWLSEFMKANPDLAHEMSVRMKAVINGKNIKDSQGGGGSMGGGGGMRQPPATSVPQIKPNNVLPMRPPSVK